MKKNFIPKDIIFGIGLLMLVFANIKSRLYSPNLTTVSFILIFIGRIYPSLYFKWVKLNWLELEGAIFDYSQKNAIIEYKVNTSTLYKEIIIINPNYKCEKNKIIKIYCDPEDFENVTCELEYIRLFPTIYDLFLAIVLIILFLLIGK